jgi:CubicO group peptidase (beta-lactamase class C family)
MTARPDTIARMPTDLETALATADAWGVDHVALAVVGPDGAVASHGDLDRRFRWASLTKLATALAVLTAVDDGSIDLDESAGPPGATVRHLLAHTSGLPFDGESAVTRVESRRVYSNTGFDLLGDLLAARDDRPFAASLVARVLAPLGMGATDLVERPSQGLHGPLRDAVALARELVRPTLLTPAVATAMRTVAYPGLKGVLPGVGSFDPLDWGLGAELRGDKDPHWTGRRNSPGTFGHFGGSGTFLWVDPALDVALVCLTDRDYGPWALQAWPSLSDAVIEALAR